MARNEPPFIAVTKWMDDSGGDDVTNTIHIVLIFGLFGFAASWLIESYDNNLNLMREEVVV